MGRKRLVEVLSLGALLAVVVVAAGGFLYLHRINQGLLRAAGMGDVQAVRSFLARGANTRTRTGAGETALLLAARRGSEKTVRLLLERGADPNAADRQGVTALWWVAARDGEMPNRATLARLLLKHGADPNARSTMNGGVAVLGRAAAKGDSRLVSTLLKHGANPNARDGFGETPLRLARSTAHIRVGNLARMQQLLAEVRPEASPSVRRLVDAERRRRLAAEETVRLLIRAGAKP